MRIDPTGQRFGKLVVIRRLSYDECRAAGIPTGGNGCDCECECDCGVRVWLQLMRLRSGSTTSCGCSHRRGRPLCATRTCRYCGESKLASEFHYGRTCVRCAQSRRNRTRTDDEVQVQRLRQQAKRLEWSKVVDAYKLRVGCQNKSCNSGALAACVLDFHHKDPSSKEFGVSGSRQGSHSLCSTVSEIRKCVLLCANCHRLVHAGLLDLGGIATCEVSEADLT